MRIALTTLATAAMTLMVGVPSSSARVRACGEVSLSGKAAVVRSFSAGRSAPIGCASARSILRRFIARGLPSRREGRWACHMTSVQGQGFPADHAWCDRGSREIQASTNDYGE